MKQFGRKAPSSTGSPRRLAVLLTVSGVLLSGVVPGMAGFSGTESAATTATSGQYSAPVWFPLRHDVSGGAIKVGCTYKSSGGAYNCDGDHPFWAMDLLAGSGTPIYPAGAGFAENVTGAGYSGYGNVVVVDHGNNVKSLYAHMSQVLVSRSGQWVDTNTVIGKVGETGNASVTHLHFEISSSGKFSHGSRDPGPLQACHGSQLVTYPQAWGLTTWQGIPWGAHTAFSDGTTCTAAPAPPPASPLLTAGIRAPMRTPTDLVTSPTSRQYLGFLGLGGSRVTYSVQLTSPVGGAPEAGATVVMTGPNNRTCTAVTNAAGAGTCGITYGLFNGPSDHASFEASFAGDSAHLASQAAGLIP